MEIWKDVVGYEGYYQVSNLGNIKSLTREIVYSDGHMQTVKGKKLHPHLTKHGYLLVGLNKNNIKKRKHVHDLVAEAFIENPLGLEEVNHKDYNKGNNCVDNLEWITHEDNMNDMFKHYNVKTQNFCPDCGKLIGNASKRCISCNNRHRYNRFILPISRNQLKSLIRTTSFKSIGKIYGVSDNTIKKWCLKLELPNLKSKIESYSDCEWALI